MSYADLLRRYIEESGMTLEEIAKACKERGLDIHPTYISKLRTGARPAPSNEKISRILAEVTGGDPEALIIQGYIDRAPEAVKPILEAMDPLFLETLVESGEWGSYEQLFADIVRHVQSKEREETSAELMKEAERIKQRWPEKPTPEEVIESGEFPRLAALHPYLLQSWLNRVYDGKISLVDLAQEPNILHPKLRDKMIESLPEDQKKVAMAVRYLSLAKLFLEEAAKASGHPELAPRPFGYRRIIEGTEAMPVVPIPILGVIHAGDSIPAEQEIIGWTAIPKAMGPAENFFALRVRGDCMAAGPKPIHDGDVVIVRKQPTAQNGEIAVVLWPDVAEAQLRRIYRRDGSVILRADNPAYPPEVVQTRELQILGVVVGIQTTPAAAREVGGS